ncbi:hypothetical protein [Pseudodesulfovibrio sediminis]|uniref:Glycerophosphoryl diester phosphodiesterase membrane domain-containing protein n=1 Tax=Pseudodesulfovibrio sediminis TaxID=2810563 RepID=A0ABN6EWN8_9BACT|nr:hypothetical protein [Pseudodesulfovibrio sediminis]BCS89556.1 hypothetical protein PSDVSF_27980 [Pseudodesulfovibrio sediminis]
MDYEIKELGIGGVLDQSLGLIKDNLGMILKITVVSLLVMAVIVGLAMWNSVYIVTINEWSATLPWPKAAWLFPAFLLAIGVYLSSIAAVVAFFSKRYLGELMTLKQAFAEGFKRSFALGWTNLLKILAIGLVVGACIGGQFAIQLKIASTFAFLPHIVVPLVFLFAIYMFMRWGIADQVVVIERISGPKALKRSSFLMKKNKWKLLVISILLIVFVALTRLSALLFPNDVVRLAIVFSTQFVSFFVGTIATTVLYFSARCQKESFDLQMLADSLAATDGPETQAETAPVE